MATPFYETEKGLASSPLQYLYRPKCFFEDELLLYNKLQPSVMEDEYRASTCYTYGIILPFPTI